MTKKKVLAFRTFLLIGFIVSGFLFTLVAFVFVAFSLQSHFDKKVEKRIEQHFYEEAAKLPEVQVKRFFPWEADSIVDIEIANKGSVTFWYGKDHVPRIWKIGPYDVDFTCYYVDDSGKKLKYAYNTTLDLDDQSTFDAWIPIRVRNLQELVSQYDQLIELIGKLPPYPKKDQLMYVKDGYSNREIIANPDPNFVMSREYKGKKVTCDLYRR